MKLLELGSSKYRAPGESRAFFESLVDIEDHRLEPKTTRCVYFIQAEGGGPIKIGTSFCGGGLSSRIGSLQTGNPQQLVVRRVVEGGIETEKAIHAIFDGARLWGEWFASIPEVALVARAIPGETNEMLAPILAKAKGEGYDEGYEEGEFHTRNWLADKLIDMIGLDIMLESVIGSLGGPGAIENARRLLDKREAERLKYLRMLA